MVFIKSGHGSFAERGQVLMSFSLSNEFKKQTLKTDKHSVTENNGSFWGVVFTF